MATYGKRDLPIQSLKILWRLMQEEENLGWRQIEAVARRQKIRLVEEVLDKDGKIDWSILKWTPSRDTGLQIKTWLSQVQGVELPLRKLPRWTWKNGKQVGKSWKLPNQFWSLEDILEVLGDNHGVGTRLESAQESGNTDSSRMAG
ncbi:hypothetical protein R1sor_003733 [Riccia sorocarpa]|uniref:Uncharacterized protein n=1 Tax=Riccia sorocarpa TaxID=122646 RepID=A0ABD3H4L5_9MARC